MRGFAALAVMAVLGGVGIVMSGGCTVKLSDETPGAKKSCNQSEANLNLFYCGAFRDVIVLEGCTGCHIDGAAGGNAMKFDVSAGTNCCPNCYASNPTIVQTNFCTAFLKGDKLVDFPRSDAHTGANLAQQYTTTEIQGLIDWVADQKGN